jgi:hypothetical protein
VMCLASWAAAAATAATAGLSLRAKVVQGTHEALTEVMKRMNR